MRNVDSTDVVIVGSGVAGLSAALAAADNSDVVILTKGKATDCCTQFSQGGVAVALSPVDSPELHMEDTLAAGAGLCEPEAVRVLVSEGVGRVKELIALGARFDSRGGHLEFGKEAAHSRRRVIHSQGDATGAEIERALLARIEGHPRISILEEHLVTEILVDEEGCFGLHFLNGKGKRGNFLASVTILASGGAGNLYLYTTNPETVTGDGAALAYGAGAALTDLEFMQFHPTAMYGTTGHCFLLSEALRGEGATLRNWDGVPFMDQYHPLADLAPRDVVSRAIWIEMKQALRPHVFLNLTHLGKERIEHRFPMIHRTCLEQGLDISSQWIPVAPAAHYYMGGIRTDLQGATTVRGLLACGEAAVVGVHGANRLASNSLLDGLVFGHRAGVSASRLANSTPKIQERSGRRHVERPESHGRSRTSLLQSLAGEVRRIMWEHVGIIRDKEGLEQAIQDLQDLGARVAEIQWPDSFLDFRRLQELHNLLQVGELAALAALTRRESRGAHYRSDFPLPGEGHWKKHILWVKGKEPVYAPLSHSI